MYDYWKLKGKDEPYLPQRTPPLTVELEARVLQRVKELCEKKLSEYPGTLQVTNCKGIYKNSLAG